MRVLLFYLFFLVSFLGYSQKTVEALLKKHNKESIPYIMVKELEQDTSKAILLDSRELKEYETSHLKSAIHVGYDHFELQKILELVPDKSSKIVVYCSLGIRSEDVGEQLKEAGYTNVLNLFGGIFEWKNEGFNVYNSKDKPTEKIHTFSKEWSRWLLKGKKIYD